MKKKFFSVLLALVLVLSFSLVTAVPVSAAGNPTIDGAIGTGEWDGAVSIPVKDGMGTVKLLASTDYLYILFDVVDSGDHRDILVSGSGNDQISININPTAGVDTWGFPYDLIFETSALSDGVCGECPDDGGHHCLPWNPKVNSGNSDDGWSTRWFPNDAQETLPAELESATTYTGTERITEWKIPLASSVAPSPGDTLQLGGAIDVGDGNSYTYPVDLDWDNPSTFAEYSLIVENEDTGLYYQTIQDAIDAADPYDTILVDSGMYYEHIRIDEALTVKSTFGAEQTIIDGIAFRYMVEIKHSDVTFEGFTVTNPTYEGGADATGILVHTVTESVNNVQILNNIVTQVRSETGTSSMYGATGINIGYATTKGFTLSDVVISGNTITNIKNPDGALIDHTCGINVWDGADNIEISNNTISDIKYNGILLQGASIVLIEDNPMITECETGIRVEPFEEGAVSDVTVNSNNFADNLIQVFDGAFEVLDIEAVLSNNTFDRAVVVDHEGSLLHTIWSKIQDGVVAAQTSDTINVAAGLYDERLTISKSLDLRGANAGINPVTETRGPESVILGPASQIAVSISAHGVTVDGFEVNGSGAGMFGIAETASFTGTTVENNIVHGFAGLGIVSGAGSSGGSVLNNEVTDTHAGVYLSTGTADFLIEGNWLHDNVRPTGVFADGGSGVVFEGNNTSVTVTNNALEYNNFGLYVWSGYGNDFSGTTVSFNSIAGNLIAGVENTSGGTIDATNNWWDDVSGPAHASNTAGTGDPVSDGVAYSPWLGDPLGTEMMTFVELATGADPPPVELQDEAGDPIATVDISGGDASQGTIGGTSGHPDEPSISLFGGTGKTGVLFLDVKVTGYTSGWAHITVPYDENALGDVVEDTLGLYYWDEATSMWRIAVNSAVDTINNNVSGDIPVSALTGTPLGGGGYPADEATVEIASIANLSFSGNDVVALTITTKTAQLGAATIDLTFNNTVVEVLGGENGAFDSLTVNPTVGPQTARFVANQLGATGVDATDGAVLAQVRLKAVGNTGSSSPLTLVVITLKDNDGISIPYVTPPTHGTAAIGGLGDANSDGAVDVYDCVFIARAIAEIPGYSVTTAVADVSGDGIVDAWDCTYLARHLAGIPSHPLGG